METKFYTCRRCGDIVVKVRDTGEPLVCCGETMEELVPGTTEGAAEKHLPVYEVKDGVVTVRVGSVDHPMTAEHWIEWVFLKTKQGSQWKSLPPEGEPAACFALCDGDAVEAVYAFCNLHSLWKV